MQVTEYVPVSEIANNKICNKGIKKNTQIIHGKMKDFRAENKLVFLLNKFIILHTYYYYDIIFIVVSPCILACYK
jgi:hypothetical protein